MSSKRTGTPTSARARAAATARTTLRTIATAAAVVLLAGGSADATTHLFSGGAADVELALTGSGIPVTLSGGQVLYRAFNFVPGHDGVLYATTSRTPGYANPITITFGAPVTGVRMTLYNLGATRLQFGTSQVSAHGIRQHGVGGSVTQVSLQAFSLDEEMQPTPDWDFGVFRIATDQGDVVLPALPPPPAPAGVTITRIVDSRTPVPGGDGTLFQLGSASIHGGVVAFLATGAGFGIYTGGGGEPELLLGPATTVPGTSATFAGLGMLPVIEGDTLTFSGSGGGRQGIYLASRAAPGEPLTVVADTATPIPGGTGTFTSGMGSPASSAGDVAFLGAGAEWPGVFTNRGGALQTIARRHDPMPDGDGTFSSFAAPAIGTGAIAFIGSGSAPDGMGGNVPRRGLYRFADGVLTRVADETTPIPNGSGAFTDFASVAVAGDAVYFSASGAAGQGGIYRETGGVLETVVRTGTPIPDGGLGFRGFGAIAVSGSALAFAGNGYWGQSGVYLLHDGVLRALFSQNNPLPGDRVASGIILSTSSLHGSDVVMRAGYANDPGGVGIFRLSVPPLCGDAALGGDEQCDDGNLADGDGCSATCRVEDLCTQLCARPSALHVKPSNAALAGTPGADVLCGDERRNVLRGNRGDDVLCGFGGDDTLYGGDGADLLDGGDGADALRGDDGDDVLRGGAGADVLQGGAGADDLDGGDGDDVLRGGAGADVLDGGEGFDRLYGQAGADACSGEVVLTCDTPP